jgi:hypothetical protein
MRDVTYHADVKASVNAKSPRTLRGNGGYYRTRQAAFPEDKAMVNKPQAPPGLPPFLELINTIFRENSDIAMDTQCLVKRYKTITITV